MARSRMGPPPFLSSAARTTHFPQHHGASKQTHPRRPQQPQRRVKDDSSRKQGSERELPSFQIISCLHQTPFITLSLKSKPGPGTRKEQAQASFCAQQQSISLRSWSFTSEGHFKEEGPCVLIRLQCNLGEAQEQQHSPLSLLEKRAALMSLSSASQALLCACSGNFPLKSSRHSSASATYLSSKRQRARRKWAFRWQGFRDMAFRQSLRAS